MATNEHDDAAAPDLKDKQLTVRIDLARRRCLHQLAADQGVTASAWLRATIDEASSDQVMADRIGSHARSLENTSTEPPD